MVDALIPLCRQIERSDARVVILTGEGGKSFSRRGRHRGVERLVARGVSARHWVRDGHAAFDALARLRQPLIAVLNGHTSGRRAGTGGLRRPADRRGACEDRPAGDRAWASFPAGPAPSAPCAALARRWCGAWRCSARFSRRSRRLRLGLVDQVVANGRRADGGRGCCGPAAGAVAASDRADQDADQRRRGRRAGARARGACRAHGRRHRPNLAEGLAAFRDKRKPRFWRGRDRMIRHIVALEFTPDVTEAEEGRALRRA